MLENQKHPAHHRRGNNYFLKRKKRGKIKEIMRRISVEGKEEKEEQRARKEREKVVGRKVVQ